MINGGSRSHADPSHSDGSPSTQGLLIVVVPVVMVVAAIVEAFRGAEKLGVSVVAADGMPTALRFHLGAHHAYRRIQRLVMLLTHTPSLAAVGDKRIGMQDALWALAEQIATLAEETRMARGCPQETEQ